MKNLVNLEGVSTLSKMEQKNINGGEEPIDCKPECESNADCGPMRECFTGTCLSNPTQMCRDIQ